ncbi:uncharacterized protein [Procambarus clarkii]|uniref:uncharacterized protein n=1 Tax=Procambarus clarkii TaxID=6728 RepID=UPI001E67350C|nr:uncharacterized protein LOC123754962 [Procambarus clarkii]XP_045593272.1 uncharacterized protein LOC123754962 [Procambarus clarkii]
MLRNTSVKVQLGVMARKTTSPDPLTYSLTSTTHREALTHAPQASPPLNTDAPPPEDIAEIDYFQNDYTEDRHLSSSTHPRPQPYPEVVVSAVVPVFQEPRAPYGHHVRGGLGTTFNKVPSPPTVSVGTVTVRVEEICLVLVVLMLWAGAITLFINRWGKLRMLEPYQPAYTAPVVPPRPPPPPMGPCINIQSTSDLTLTEGGAAGGRYDWGAPESYGRGSLASGYLGLDRSPSCLSVRTLNPQRKVKSAVDLVSLVMQEKMSSSIHLAATNV